MPYCSILQCKNVSTKTNLSVGGVSFHRYPKDPNTKEKWIDATGRVNWMPVKSSTVCSAHFREDEFYLSIKGYRYLKTNVYPTQKVVKYISEENDATADLSTKQKNNYNIADLSQPRKIRKKDSIQPPSTESKIQNTCNTTLSPSERILHKKLQFCQNKIKKQLLQIKLLQSRNMRLRKLVNDKNESIKRLIQNFDMLEQNLDHLKNT